MNREGFEKWIAQSGLLGGGNLDDVVTRPLSEKSWQAAINSLEVTPELTRIAQTAYDATPGIASYSDNPAMADALTAVFNAIKERQNG
jgi:hypothetical protein